MTLTCGIIISCDIDCHVLHTGTSHVVLFFFKNLKRIKKNHKLTCDTLLTALINSVWKGPNWNTFSKVGM